MFTQLLLCCLFTFTYSCSVSGPLPTFDEILGNSSYAVSGVIKDRVFMLDCPTDTSPPIYASPSDDPNADIRDINATAVIDVFCIHKGQITCLTPSGFQVKSAGDVISEECLVYVYGIDTVTSCRYWIEAGFERTFFMKDDGDTENVGPCFQSTYGLENYVYGAVSEIIPDTCTNSISYPECPLLDCFNVASDSCCGGQYNVGDWCWVERQRLSYQYQGECQGQKVFQNSRIGRCYCA